jgi:hypothetical protein
VWVDEPWNPILPRAILHLWKIVLPRTSSDLILPVEGFVRVLSLSDILKDKSKQEFNFEEKRRMLKSLIRESKSRSKRDIHLYALAFVSAASSTVTLFIVVSFMFMR